MNVQGSSSFLFEKGKTDEIKRNVIFQDCHSSFTGHGFMFAGPETESYSGDHRLRAVRYGISCAFPQNPFTETATI